MPTLVVGMAPLHERNFVHQSKQGEVDMNTRIVCSRRLALVLLLLQTALWPTIAAAKEKVILDTDMGILNDDAYVLFMLLKSEKTELLGVTVCSGNTWIEEGLAYSLRHLESFGRNDIPVVPGVAEPLLGSRVARLDAEEKLFGKLIYRGAYARPRPASRQTLQEPPYGGYPKTEPACGHGVDFIVNQVKRHPHQVTLLVIGPTTTVATR